MILVLVEFHELNLLQPSLKFGVQVVDVNVTEDKRLDCMTVIFELLLLLFVVLQSEVELIGRYADLGLNYIDPRKVPLILMSVEEVLMGVQLSQRCKLHWLLVSVAQVLSTYFLQLAL